MHQAQLATQRVLPLRVFTLCAGSPRSTEASEVSVSIDREGDSLSLYPAASPGEKVASGPTWTHAVP